MAKPEKVFCMNCELLNVSVPTGLQVVIPPPVRCELKTDCVWNKPEEFGVYHNPQHKNANCNCPDYEPKEGVDGAQDR